MWKRRLPPHAVKIAPYLLFYESIQYMQIIDSDFYLNVTPGDISQPWSWWQYPMNQIVSTYVAVRGPELNIPMIVIQDYNFPMNMNAYFLFAAAVSL